MIGSCHDTKKASTLKPRILAAAAASALALPIIASMPAPAQAATTRHLTVTVIDRTGQPAATADVQLLNVGTGTGIDLGTRRHRQLRPGTYNVAAWIITGNGASQTYTLADKIIDLTADKTVVLDARKGNRVRLSLNNPAASAETLEIAPIVRGNWAFNPTTIAPPPGAAYVVPMRSKLMALYVYSIWEKTGNSVANPSPFRYDIIRVFRGSIPSSPVIVGPHRAADPRQNDCPRDGCGPDRDARPDAAAKRWRRRPAERLHDPWRDAGSSGLVSLARLPVAVDPELG